MTSEPGSAQIARALMVARPIKFPCSSLDVAVNGSAISILLQRIAHQPEIPARKPPPDLRPYTERSEVRTGVRTDGGRASIPVLLVSLESLPAGEDRETLQKD
ncbi:hypothetical protein GCM10022223_60100 [Kineosporia mesophila]|uniref:Uncharacterized protein n=1 Tax=Kineosporia mesophila TaxID=566012 RepID=A0ABP7AJ29_9ACTN